MLIEHVKRITIVSYLLLFLLVAALMALGLYFRSSSPIMIRIVPYTQPHIRNAYWVSVALGILLIPVACVGFYSLYRMNVVLLTWQVALMFSMVLMISGLGLFCITKSATLKLEEPGEARHLDQMFEPYYEDKKSQKFINWIQETFHCCGAHGVFWWHRINHNFNPESCFKDDEYRRLVMSYTLACNVQIIKFIKQSTTRLGYMILGVAAALILLMFFPVQLVYIFRKRKEGHWDANETETETDTENETGSDTSDMGTFVPIPLRKR